MNRNAKSEKVLDIAFELLRNEGDYGVTMRKVASNANMSLSNVQYYFKNKDELLKAVADRYFKACLEEARGLKPIESDESAKRELEMLIRSLLNHGLNVSEMCKVFREYWAISTRNAAIDDYIKSYYKEWAIILSDKLATFTNTRGGISKAVSILIPLVEGYSITALALPENIDSVSEEMTTILFDLITG